MWSRPRLRNPTQATRTVSLGLASARVRVARPAATAELRKCRRFMSDSLRRLTPRSKKKRIEKERNMNMRRKTLRLFLAGLIAGGAFLLSSAGDRQWKVLGPGGGGAQFYPAISPHDSAR